MITALYYPHTHVRSTGLLKQALLLWDRLECIVPPGRTIANLEYPRKIYAEAAELIRHPHPPSATEQERAHRAVNELLATSPPKTFLEAALSDGVWRADYLMYPEKFTRHTWQLLEQHGVAAYDDPSADYAVPPALGLLMMSLLADQCAGTQKQKITDRGAAYAWLTERMATRLGGGYFPGVDASDISPDHDRLVSISLKTLGAKKLSIRKLVAMRKRELKGGGGDYRALRKRYRDALQGFIAKVGQEARTATDVRELERQFRADIRQDLYDLKKELGEATVEALVSKEMLFTAIVLGGSLVNPISGITNVAVTMKGLGVAPLLKSGAKYRQARRKVLRQHAMSWLYLANQRRLTWR